MALSQRQPFETADRSKLAQDDSDVEEETMVEDYKEQVHFDDGMDDLDRTTSYGGSGGGAQQDIQAQLAAAATPLEYQATLETKFASYDSYCGLFHLILNSEGPIDLEVPTVCNPITLPSNHTNGITVLLGLGRRRRIHLPIRILLSLPQPHCPHPLHHRARLLGRPAPPG